MSRRCVGAWSALYGLSVLSLSGCMHSCGPNNCAETGQVSARSLSNPATIALAVYQERDQDAADSSGDKERNGKEDKDGKDKNGKDGEKKEKGPKEPAKVLLSWNLGPEEQSDDSGVPEPEEPLATDRPDFTEASSNVGRGRVQLEMGYTYIQDSVRREASGNVLGHPFGHSRQHSYPEILLRIGMFADWLELRIGQNFGNTTEPGTIEPIDSTGMEDLYFGIGIGLTEQRGIFPESRIVLQMRVPTGSDKFTAERVLPGFNYLYGWDIIPDKITMGASSQANRVVDDSNHFYTLWAQSLTTGFWFTDRFGSYFEWFGLFPSGAIDPGAGPEYYLDGGFMYRVTNNFQLDIRAGFGLNRHAADFFAGSGFAIRF